MRRSAPDSGVLIRLKAQMAEVRSKMSDVKSQVMEARGAEPRPGTSGGFAGEESPSQHGDSKPGELELLDRGAAAAARSRPCRHGQLRHVLVFASCLRSHADVAPCKCMLPAVIIMKIMLLLSGCFIVRCHCLFFLCFQLTKAVQTENNSNKLLSPGLPADADGGAAPSLLVFHL